MYEYLFFSNNLTPFRLYRLMTNAKKMLLTPILDINLDDANAVPPVAIKSSIIIMFLLKMHSNIVNQFKKKKKQ